MSEKYDYYEAVRKDAEYYIRLNDISLEGCREDFQKTYNELYHRMICEKSITGADFGYFSDWAAEEAVSHNWDVLMNILNEMDDCEAMEELNKGMVYCDTLIRKYTLEMVLEFILEDYIEHYDQREAMRELYESLGKDHINFLAYKTGRLAAKKHYGETERAERLECEISGYVNALENQGVLTEDEANWIMTDILDEHEGILLGMSYRLWK